MYILAQIFHYNFDERFGLNPRGMGMPQIFQNFFALSLPYRKLFRLFYCLRCAVLESFSN